MHDMALRRTPDELEPMAGDERQHRCARPDRARRDILGIYDERFAEAVPCEPRYFVAGLSRRSAVMKGSIAAGAFTEVPITTSLAETFFP